MPWESTYIMFLKHRSLVHSVKCRPSIASINKAYNHTTTKYLVK